MSQKILIIIILVIAALGFLLGLFFYFERDNGETPTPTETVDEFFPIDEGGAKPIDTTDEGNVGTETPTDQVINQSFGGRLVKVVNSPISGFSIFSQASSTVLAYMEKSTGHIYFRDLETEETTRFTNTTLPGVMSVAWGHTASTTFTAVSYEEENTRHNLLLANNQPLNDSITQIVASPSGNKLFTLEKTGSNTVGTVRNWAGGTEKEVVSSPLTEWLVTWPEEKTLGFLTKPASNLPGSLYFLNPESNAWTKVLGGILGLNTLVSPDGKKIVYSESVGKGLRLYLFDLITKDNSLISLETIAEKCVWTKNKLSLYCAVPTNLPAGNYPDEWYRGEKTFDDSLWWINAETGETRLVWQKSYGLESGITLDAVELMLNPTETLVFFKNRLDSSLWALTLE